MGASLLPCGQSSVCGWLSCSAFQATSSRRCESGGGPPGALNGPIPPQCPWPPDESGRVARHNWQFALDTAIEANDVVLTDVQQLANRDRRRAEFDRNREP